MQEIRDPEAFRRGVLTAHGPLVVLFWATWCPFCRRFAGEFEHLSSRVAADLARVYLDDESNPLWEDYDVSVVPTIALFRDGELVDREDGVLRYGLDRRAVDAFLERVRVRLS